ncbi:hypothetical protein [Chlamydiifrater volucris]|uniref:hypothetical protein n=1 Tax=Chlamydiifrater volucris TaxID=2681470 RepID=UPI001BCF48AF|nr:hypothetical protein [Chlamydiifrater volucris]
MSAPNPSDIRSPSPSTSAAHPLSLEEQISINLELIRWLVSPRGLYDGRYKILCSQIISLTAGDITPQVLARALTVSRISLSLLMQTNSSLSTNQYRSILSACNDLSEASGSGLNTTTSTSRKRKAEKDLEESSSTTSESGSSSSDHQPTPSKQPRESSSISLFLNTVLAKKANKDAPMPCPNNTSNTAKHACDTCFSIKRLFYPGKCTLIRQSERLLNYTPVSKLSQALSLPMFRNCLKNRFLNAAEIVVLINELGIEEAVRIPGNPHPTSLLGIYTAMDQVIKLGLSSALTKTIMALWASPIVTSPEIAATNYLLVSRGSTSCLISKEFLENTLSKIEIRIVLGDSGKGGPKEQISPRLAKFLSLSVFFTLCNLLESPRGALFINHDDKSGGGIIPWDTVRHVYGLVLSLHSGWKVAVTPNRILGNEGEIGFSKEESQILSSLFHSFTVFYGLYEDSDQLPADTL